MTGKVFKQALVILQESGLREVQQREGVVERKKGIGEGKDRVESKCGLMGRAKEMCCDLTKRQPKTNRQ